MCIRRESRTVSLTPTLMQKNTHKQTFIFAYTRKDFDYDFVTSILINPFLFDYP